MKINPLLYLCLFFLLFVSCNEDSNFEEKQYIELSSTSLDCSNGNASYEIQVTSNCDWIITDKPIWVTTDITEGSGNGIINVFVDVNSNSNLRNGNIVITSKDNKINANLTVSQTGWEYNHWEDKW